MSIRLPSGTTLRELIGWLFAGNSVILLPRHNDEAVVRGNAPGT